MVHAYIHAMKRYRPDPANPRQLVPNRETIEAIKASRRGEVTTAGPPGKLLKSLNADEAPITSDWLELTS